MPNKSEKISDKIFFVTTPIYYPNADPHIGHCYTDMAADAVARFYRQRGSDVFFLTGTDEHGEKIDKTAKSMGKTPQELVDEKSGNFRKAFDSIQITYDDFIRTTQDRHKKAVDKIFQKCFDSGDIYFDIYEGYYCLACEKYVRPTEAMENDYECDIHRRPLEDRSTLSYFFKMSKYKDFVLDFIEKNPDKVIPKKHRDSIVKRIENFGLDDVSISRPISQTEWGIPIKDEKINRRDILLKRGKLEYHVKTYELAEKAGIGGSMPPGLENWNTEKHVMYVWFDALTNYLTAVDYENEGERFKKYWPNVTHIIGRDITWFHVPLWFSMLKSAGIEDMPRVFSHGFWNVKDEKTSEALKMSKTLGNVIDPVSLSKQYGVDPVRHYLLSEVAFGEEGEFSYIGMINKTNNDLADNMGNLLNRTLVLTAKSFDSIIPEAEEKNMQTDIDFADKQKAAARDVEKYMEELQLSLAVGRIMENFRNANAYVNETKPWELIKSRNPRLKTVIYNLNEAMRFNATLLYPFLPNTANEILASYNREIVLPGDFEWGQLNSGEKIADKKILFEKIDLKKLTETEAEKREPIKFYISKGASDLGLVVDAAVFRNLKISNKSLPLRREKERVEKILKEKEYLNEPILAEFRRLQKELLGREDQPSAEYLIRMVKEGEGLPEINTAVDAYNAVSAETLLSIGVHDIEKLEGNEVFVKIADGTERYVALGQKEPSAVKAGEYVIMDGKRVICEMDIKQCEETQVTKETRDIFVYTMGNKESKKEDAKECLNKVEENFRRFCGPSQGDIERENIEIIQEGR